MKMHIDTQIASLEDERERAVFNLLFLFIQSVENTNAFLPNRNPEVVAFKLNHEVVQKIADHFMITYPTDITYVYSTRTGSHAIGARYGGGVSKGGDRYQPTNKSTYEAVSRSSLIDALRLAWTQELKNLLWGCYVNGLKTVLVAAPVVAENAGLDELIAAIKAIEESIAFPAIKAALFELEIDVDQEIRTTLAEENHDEINELLAKLVQLENLVNLSFGEFDLGNLGDKRPGPDMRMTPAEMDFLAYVAKHLGVLNWEAIYTGKSLEFGGFPHAKFMVTGRGVFENMLIALERLKIDPEQGAVTASIQGFGDVGGSMAYLILNKKRSIKITAISDHTGMLVCPEGFASKKEWEDELERLRQKGLTIDQFSPALLGEGLELRGRDRIDEIVTMPSTIFIPAAIGNVIHKGNVAEFLKAHELTVEGANIAFTPEAARTFDKALGKRILDVMANGGGVSTSTSEILNTQILGVDQFKGRLNRLAQDNEASIIKTTRDNAKYFWDEYERMEGSVSIPDLVHQVVRGMTVMKSIIKVGYEANQEQNGVYSFLFDSVAKSIAETVDPDEILDRLSQSIVREAIATQLARKIAFSHPYDWFNTIPADQRDTFILAEVEKIIAARDETAK